MFILGYCSIDIDYKIIVLAVYTLSIFPIIGLGVSAYNYRCDPQGYLLLVVHSACSRLSAVRGVWFVLGVRNSNMYPLQTGQAAARYCVRLLIPGLW